MCSWFLIKNFSEAKLMLIESDILSFVFLRYHSLQKIITKVVISQDLTISNKRIKNILYSVRFGQVFK